MKLCDYGCGQVAKYKFKNGKDCCSEKYNSCPNMKLMVKNRLKKNNPLVGRHHTKEHNQKIAEAQLGEKNHRWKKSPSKETRKKISDALKGRKSPHQLTLKRINKRYPLFSKIEDISYDAPSKKIQVHCKNHNCKNSKEKGGWFTPSYSQLYERIRQIEKGAGGCYFYCSEECKSICPLFNLITDPLQTSKQQYTQEEYQQFRKYVLKRDKYKCQYCEEKADYVHHERPQKLEPFFALDPDLTWSVCKKCHYEKGHQDECSTGRLASKIC